MTRARPRLPGVPAVDDHDADGRQRHAPVRSGRRAATASLVVALARACAAAVAQPRSQSSPAWRWSGSARSSPRRSPPAMSAASPSATKRRRAASICHPIIAADSPGPPSIGQLFDRFGWPAAIVRRLRGACRSRLARASSSRVPKARDERTVPARRRHRPATFVGSLEQFLTSRVAEVAPDFARMAIEFPFGDLYARDGARPRKPRNRGDRGAGVPRPRGSAAATACCGRAATLASRRAEIVEILMQTAMYGGFPAAINALAECHDLLTDDDCVGGSCRQAAASARDSAALPARTLRRPANAAGPERWPGKSVR